jgi:hypothetical protein
MFADAISATNSSQIALAGRLIFRGGSGNLSTGEAKAVRRAVAALKKFPELTPGINVQIEMPLGSATKDSAKAAPAQSI